VFLPALAFDLEDLEDLEDVEDSNEDSTVSYGGAEHT
jgi:hypothetical protein